MGYAQRAYFRSKGCFSQQRVHKIPRRKKTLRLHQVTAATPTQLCYGDVVKAMVAAKEVKARDCPHWFLRIIRNIFRGLGVAKKTPLWRVVEIVQEAMEERKTVLEKFSGLDLKPDDCYAEAHELHIIFKFQDSDTFTLTGPAVAFIAR